MKGHEIKIHGCCLRACDLSDWIDFLADWEFCCGHCLYHPLYYINRNVHNAGAEYQPNVFSHQADLAL